MMSSLLIPIFQGIKVPVLNKLSVLRSELKKLNLTTLKGKRWKKAVLEVSYEEYLIPYENHNM